MEKIIEVIWTKRSSLDLRKIFDFNSQLKDKEKAGEIVNSIIDTVEESLINKLDVGAKDQQFAHKDDPFSEGPIEAQYQMALAVPGDQGYFVKEGNLMVDTWSNALSMGQVKFLYKHSGGTIVPALTGQDFSHGYNGVLIGNISESESKRAVSVSFMKAHNYYGEGLKSKNGKKAYSLLPESTRKAIDARIESDK